MIFLPKDKFEAKALRLAMILLQKERPPIFDGCLEGKMRSARQELVNAGFAWSSDGSGYCCECDCYTYRDFHSGIAFECGSLVLFKRDGTVSEGGKCKHRKEAVQ